MAETVDEVAASLSEGETDEPEEPKSEAEETDEQEAPSMTELLVELGHDVSVLAFLEGQLAISRNVPEVRRAARDIAAAVVVGLAFATAFVFINVAALYGLSRVMSWWLAALLLAIGAAPALAQTATLEQPPVFRSGVDLVRLDIRVTDDAGRPIADLRPDEVHVREEGVARPVVLFQHVQMPHVTYAEAAAP